MSIGKDYDKTGVGTGRMSSKQGKCLSVKWMLRVYDHYLIGQTIYFAGVTVWLW
jgi:hypothetical protein